MDRTQSPVQPSGEPSSEPSTEPSSEPSTEPSDETDKTGCAGGIGLLPLLGLSLWRRRKQN